MASSLKSVCVFCSSSESLAQSYKDDAYKLGKIFAQNEIRLVYGGSRKGLMGAIADSVIEAGGQTIGFMPRTLHKTEIGHSGLTELFIVDSMHERKRLMFEYCDAIVVLPGGFGTLDEVSEIITWKQIHLHTKPIIILNTNNYWEGLFQVFVDHMVKEGCVRPEHKNLFRLVDKVDEVVSSLEQCFRPPKTPNKFKAGETPAFF